MLIDLRRIINLLRPNAWLRMMLGVFLASILLHAVVLDFWRGRVSGLSSQAPGGLKLTVRVQNAQPEAAVALPAPAPVVVEEQKAQVRTPQKLAREVTPKIERETDAELGEQAAAAEAPRRSQDSTGWRPLSRMEGEVAYRLAVLEAVSRPALELPEQGVLLEVELGVDGQVLGVRALRHGGDARLAQGWVDWLRHGARHVAAPAVLHGAPSRISIEVLP